MVSPELVSGIDLYSDESLLRPYDNYQTLRAIGPLAFLSTLNMYVVARYKEVKKVLATPEVFASGHGVMMNDTVNDALGGKIGLCSDGEEHRRIRRVEARPLSPRALGELRETINQEAEALVETLVKRGSFEAVTELSQRLPLSIVSNLVGLPEEGRERMLVWAAATFDCVGPLNARGRNSLGVFQEMQAYAAERCVRGKLKPGSWAEKLHDAADAGEISPDEARSMALSYMGPSLDTTVHAISNAVWLFARYPDQWAALCENPELIPNAINEVLRLESPVQSFSRFTEVDYVFDSCTLPARSRVIVLYGSANRDERRWTEPETFDVHRNGAGEQLSFGYGAHACVGMNLARMEISALLIALSKRVRRFEEISSERALNNTLRGFRALHVSVTRR